ncbi:hypothetical protein [Paenarthrobacter histidinolovorans]|uniref:hypothetical protein n=1 Tax=Paenarthrobacter histidinolovorans TaxID=43664 RepID=UPI001666EDD2|nr:hypothetical protein [Paenarthrobacter histidinolovorans]GGJ41725.1 hypothetical protein GCM10010052_43590 [Paenarthrobacter histidinolovorans]
MTESPEIRQDADEIAWFPARELVDAMKAEGLELHVDQTGGGTATLFLQREGSHTFTIGPGSYSWNAPLESEFTTAELHYGPDHYDEDGEPVDFPGDEEKTITPGTPIADIAKEIAANFRRFNTHTTPERDSAT